MRKERIFILFLLMITVLGVMFFGLYVIAQRNLESTREQLQAEVAEIEERYQQYVNSKTQPAAETVPDVSLPDDSGNEVNMDTITALEQIDEKIRSLESDERKIKGVIADIDAIYFVEKDWESLSDSQKKMVKDFFRDNHDLILEIRQLAATGGPFGKLDFSKGKDMTWPHLPRISNCRYLLASDAFLAALSGDYEEAAKNYIAILQFGESTSKEPLNVSYFNTRRSVECVYEGISEYLPEGNLSSDTALKVIKQVSRLNEREVFAESLKMEMVSITATFDEIRMGDYEPVFKPRGIDALIERFNASLIGRPFLLMDELAYVDIEERISEIIRLPFYQAKPQLDRINREIDMLPITSSFSRMALPLSATYYPERRAHFEAKVGLLQIGLAVELHHAQHGIYPQSLDEIAPTLAGEVPLDPYTGENFVYKPGPESFVLYSARSTVIDDPSGSQFVCYSDQEGNLVWRGPEDWREE